MGFKAVIVAATINVQSGQVRLLRAHVTGVPMNCSKAVKNVFSVND